MTSSVVDDEERQQGIDPAYEGSGRTTSDDPAASDAVDRLPKDLVFGLLANERRRLVLEVLAEESSTTLSDLAERVASIENGKPKLQVTSDERKRVYVTLYQSHLPQMDAANVIEYDQQRGTIERRPEANQLETCLAAYPDQPN